MLPFDASDITVHAPSNAAEAAMVNAFTAHTGNPLAGFGSVEPVTGRVSYPVTAHAANGAGIVYYKGLPLHYRAATDSDGHTALDDQGNPRREYFSRDAEGICQFLNDAGCGRIEAAAKACDLLPPARQDAVPATDHGKQYEGVRILTLQVPEPRRNTTEHFNPQFLSLREPQNPVEEHAVELLDAFGGAEGINMDPVRIDGLSGERYFLATARRGDGSHGIVQYWGRDLHWTPGAHGKPRHFLLSEEGRIDISVYRSQIRVAAALSNDGQIPAPVAVSVMSSLLARLGRS